MSTSEEEVNKFHDNDDVDGSKFAHHHTLGPTGNQAAPGNHTHTGADSYALFNRFEDHYNVYNQPPYVYRNGFVFPDGLKFYHQDDTTTQTNTALQRVFGTDLGNSAIPVSSGHYHSVRVQGEVRPSSGSTASGIRLELYRVTGGGKGLYDDPASIPSVGVLPAPLPAADSGDEFIYGHHCLIATTSVYRLVSAEWTIPYDTSVNVHYALYLRPHSGSNSTDFRAFSMKVVDEGGSMDISDTGSNPSPTRYMGQLTHELRRMGARVGIRGEQDYYRNEGDLPITWA